MPVAVTSAVEGLKRECRHINFERASPQPLSQLGEGLFVAMRNNAVSFPFLYSDAPFLYSRKTAEALFASAGVLRVCCGVYDGNDNYRQFADD